jgi:hypothetical protein
MIVSVFKGFLFDESINRKMERNQLSFKLLTLNVIFNNYLKVIHFLFINKNKIKTQILFIIGMEKPQTHCIFDTEPA